MDKSRADENQVLAWFRTMGLNPVRYSKKEMRKTGNKTPEFMVKKDDELLFYCEVKSIIGDVWENELRQDPTYNKIQNKIHEAVKQFRSVNRNREFPNVLVFKNNQYETDVIDLCSVLTGFFYADNGRRYRIYDSYSHGRIIKEKFFIDLYIWCQSDNTQQFCLTLDSPFKNRLCRIFKIDPENIKIIS
jgi:hypothetical protein